MIASIISLLPATLPAKFAKPIAWSILGVGGAVLLIVGFLVWDHFDDKAAVERHELKREAAAGEAREIAADQRVADAITNTRNEKDLHDAIDTAPTGGALSPAALALACERLRKAGRFPTSCRPAGGDGGQAGPR